MNARPVRPSNSWEFEYHPLSPHLDPQCTGTDVVVATTDPIGCATLLSAVQALDEEAEVREVLSVAPVHWNRVRLSSALSPAILEERLRRGGVAVRYVALATRGSLRLGPSLDVTSTSPVLSNWKVRPESEDSRHGDLSCWSQGPLGVRVDRIRFGSGAGTRLAVVDDDAAQAGQVFLDAEVLIHVPRGPRAQPHGTLMVGWAVGSKLFRGIAPDASPRLYCIPKPEGDVLSLPTAIVRAVAEGADVVLCPGYVDGMSSPMLDDALEFASRLGRGGRGTVVVMPTGREASSAPWSTHVSWSLGLGEPASDPRVLCVAPASPGGRWFLWQDRRGRLRPFSNRGPAVRCMAPGDDMTSPLDPEKTSHAESSGASAVAAGVSLLVLAANPTLRAEEVMTILRRTARAPRGLKPSEFGQLADPWDALPAGRDADGHDAKHGYGGMDVQRACLGASDPVCLALICMGEEQAALRWFDLRRADLVARSLVSFELGHWMARACLMNESLLHQVSVVLRHLRLVASHAERMEAHGAGALTRQWVLLLRSMAGGEPGTMPQPFADELKDLADRLSWALERREACQMVERVAFRLAKGVFSGAKGEARAQAEAHGEERR